jgi:hypothetical protein
LEPPQANSAALNAPSDNQPSMLLTFTNAKSIDFFADSGKKYASRRTSNLTMSDVAFAKVVSVVASQLRNQPG